MKERIIDDEIRLIPYYRNDKVSLPWYQDLDVCKQVDNRDEPYDLELLDFNGAEARYYYKEDYSLLVTTIDGYALYITGPVTKEEIMKIAYGIQR